MTVSEILSGLERYTGKFPEAAMRAAIEQREAITPELLRVLQAVADNAPKHAAERDYMLPIFALLLLAQFRERRAYPLVLKLVSWPRETVDQLLGDVITEELPSILASTFDGQIEPLIQLALNEQVDEFVSGSAVEAIALLHLENLLPREELLAIFRRLYRELEPRGPSQAANSLVTTIREAALDELVPELRRAFAQGMVEEGFTDLEFEEARMAKPPAERIKEFKKFHHLIESAIDELSWWACFQEEAPRPPSPPEPVPAFPSLPVPPPPEYKAPEPVVRAEPKIGRNDPCPCGSGKKYKKCCLNRLPQAAR